MASNAKETDKLRLAKKKKPRKTKERSVRKKVARSVQDTIPYEHVCNNYIFEVEKNHYSKTYSFSDVTYTAASNEEQERIFLAYGDLLNSFDTTDDIQITLHNNVINEREFKERILLKHMDDGYDEYRDEYNEMLLDKMQQGQNGITTKKYITVTVTAVDLQTAQQKFTTNELHMRASFQKIGSNLVPLKANERIRIIADIFRGVNKDIRAISSSEFNRGAEKSLCCPDYFEFKKDYFLFNDTYARMLFVRQLPSSLQDKILSDICETSLPLIVTVNIAPVDPAEAQKKVKRQLTNMRSNKIQAEKKAARHGVVSDVISDDLKQLNDSKIYEHLRGHWIMEMSEMIAAISAKSNEEIKSFLTRQKDTYRNPYDKYEEDRKRQCIFAGSTNTRQFIPFDRTGARRFLPIAIDSSKAEKHILDDEKEARSYFDQLWAEAMEIYWSTENKSSLLKFSKEMEQEISEYRKQFTQEDTMAGMIQGWLDAYKGSHVCSVQIWKEAFDHFDREPKKFETNEICSIMDTQITGWKRAGVHRFSKEGYGRQRSWIREGAEEEGGNEPDKDGFTKLTKAEQLELPFDLPDREKG